MALKKAITQDDGVVTSYHRILYLTITPNRQNSIAIASYVDEESRDAEKDDANKYPYKIGVTYETSYDQEMTIEGAYEYLKTLEEFKEAEDI